MNGNLVEVFNTYNVNILFTVAALPARVALGQGPIMAPPQQPGTQNQALLMQGGNSASNNTPNSGKVNVIPPSAQKNTVQLPPITQKKFGDDEPVDDLMKKLVSDSDFCYT